MRSLLSWCLVTVCLAGASIGQSLSGVVRDFAGQPAPHAVVRVFGADGSRIVELVTDPNGTFACEADRPYGRLQAQIEGVLLDVPVQAGGEANVAVSFEDLQYVTLAGTFADPGGHALAGIDLRLQDETGRTICTATTVENGAFSIRVDRPVQAIVVDPLGWHFEIAQRFDAAQPIAIDLQRHRDEFFSIDGRVLDANGSPVPDAVVRASRELLPATARRTRKDGSFALWTRVPIDRILVHRYGEPIAMVLGEWKGEQSLEVDERVHGFALVAGRVADAAGTGVGQAQIFATATKSGLSRIAQFLTHSAADGSFVAYAPRCLPFIHAQREKPEQSATVAWRPGEKITITLR